MVVRRILNVPFQVHPVKRILDLPFLSAITRERSTGISITDEIIEMVRISNGSDMCN